MGMEQPMVFYEQPVYINYDLIEGATRRILGLISKGSSSPIDLYKDMTMKNERGETIIGSSRLSAKGFSDAEIDQFGKNDLKIVLNPDRSILIMPLFEEANVSVDFHFASSEKLNMYSWDEGGCVKSQVSGII